MKKQLTIALLSLALGIVEKGSAQSVGASPLEKAVYTRVKVVFGVIIS